MQLYKEGPSMTSYELADQVVRLMNDARPIQAVKDIKEWTQLSLKDAKTITDILREEMVTSYDWLVGAGKLDEEDLDTLCDFAEGVIISVVTLKRDHNKTVRYTSEDRVHYELTVD